MKTTQRNFFFTDSIMYIRYILKTLKLQYMKYMLKLDYTGRYFSKHDDLYGYEGCYAVDRLLKKLSISNNDSILDIGCGKGLLLFYAAKFDFKRIDGIEISSELTGIAQNNLLKIKDNRMHIFNIDARVFSGYDEYNYFFINNPFSEKIMNDIALKLKKISLDKKKKITVLYQFPFYKKKFTDMGFDIFYEKFPDCILTFG